MLKRIISGICLVIITAPALYFGGWFLYALCLFISLVGNYELLRVAGLEKSPLGICAYVSTVVYYILLDSADNRYSMLVIVAAFLAMMTIYVFTFPKYKAENIMWSFFGIIYVIGNILFIALLRGAEHGIILVWYAIIAAWGTDIFAYLIGKRFGKHKFSKVSPKKSIEGCIAGILGAVIIALIYTVAINSIFEVQYSYVFIGIITAILSIAGQLGDFAASSIKRYVDIKDYSNLIPGHGGMLDRIDSLMFLAPYAYILLSLI